jgi:hypothetical protein
MDVHIQGLAFSFFLTRTKPVLRYGANARISPDWFVAQPKSLVPVKKAK